MNIPVTVIERLQDTLPLVNDVEANFICKEFVYEGRDFAIYFYKAKEYTSEFWICNPFHIINVVKH